MRSLLHRLVAALLLVISTNAVLAADESPPAPIIVERSSGVPRVRMICRDRATDARLALLPQHPEVESVAAFGDENFTNAGLPHLAKLPNLHTLGLGGQHLTAAGFEPLRGNAKLRRLTLHTLPLDEPLTDFLVSLPNLEELNLRPHSVDARCWERLAKQPNLRALTLVNYSLTESDVAALQQFKQLHQLYVLGELGEPVLHTLRMALPNAVVNSFATEYSVEELRAISKSLETDSAGRVMAVNQSCLTYATDAKLHVLAGHPTIERLRIFGGPAITDVGLKWLPKLPKLETLEIRSSAITNAGLVHLQSLNSLRELRVYVVPQVTESGTEPNRAALSEFWELVAKHSKLKHLEIGHQGLGQADFEAFQRFTGLRSLRLYSQNLDAQTLHMLRSALPQTVVTDRNTSYTVEDLRAVSQSIETDSAGHVVSVNQSSGRATDEKVEALTHCRTIVRLQLGGELSDSGLQPLSKLTNLEELELQSETLTDAALPHLRLLKKLRRLTLQAPQITATAVEKLESELPDCVIVVSPMGAVAK